MKVERERTWAAGENRERRERRRLFYLERGMDIKGEEKGESVIRQIQCSIQLLRGQLKLLRRSLLALGRSGEAIIATGLEVGEAIAGDSEVRHCCNCGKDTWCSTDEDRGCVQHGGVVGGNATAAGMPNTATKAGAQIVKDISQTTLLALDHAAAASGVRMFITAIGTTAREVR